ncbi:MAG: hypothetical protein GF317_20465 [Candidatus Lokiarchaeota archaeon]|nr:hypothetical protein [Candidatus Lokiarchaeota archaeon]
MEKYFVISNSDGDTTIREYTKQALLEAIEDNEFGDSEFIGSLDSYDADTNYWGENIMIIKGEIVSPEPIEQVVKYNIK